MMTRSRCRDDLDAAGYSPEVHGYQKASQGMDIGCGVWFRGESCRCKVFVSKSRSGLKCEFAKRTSACALGTCR